MKTVFVSAASSVSGYGILRSLRRKPFPMMISGFIAYRKAAMGAHTNWPCWMWNMDTTWEDR